MKRLLLTAQPRIIVGKKVKKLRREGIIPANEYGKDINSQSIQIKLADFEKVYHEVGETGLLDLEIDGKSKPVLIKNIQKNFQDNKILHVDFYRVNLKEKVKTVIPVSLIDEPKAVTDNIGLLLQTLSDVEIEALPDQLPEKIEVSVASLEEINQHITVADLQAPEGVTILTDPGQVIAKIIEPVVEEPEPEKEGVEGEVAEGEKVTEKEGEETDNKESSEEKQEEESPEKKQEENA
jgi:large subunit ribosomal protein L25